MAGVLRGRASQQLRLLPVRQLALAAPAAQTLYVRRPGAPSVSHFHASAGRRKGLMPETSEPAPPNNEVAPEAHEHAALHPAPLGVEQFKVKATSYLEVVMARVEAVKAEGTPLEIEPSFEALNIERAGVGNYVLSQNADKRQLVLNTPAAGPRSFDWVVRGGGMNLKQDTDHHGNLDGQGTGKGYWIDVGDGSSLSAVLDEELQLGMVENFK